MSGDLQRRCGVVELFAQSACSSWPGAHATERRDFMLSPCVMERGNASTIYSAVENAVPLLAVDSIKGWAESGCVVIVDEPVDGCSANLRKRAATAADFADHASVLYHSTATCAVYKLNRVVAKTVSEEASVGHIHAVQYILSLANRSTALMQAVRTMIEEELVIVPGEPPAGLSQHSQEVLEHTLLRTLQHVR